MGFSTSRRFFLKASLLSTVLVFLHPQKALAGFSAVQKPSHRLNLYNIHTGEKIAAAYRDNNGQYNTASIEELNWLLRCHYTDQQHSIDIKTLDFLDLISTQIGCDNEIHIISGYRSPKYNNYLLSSGHKVAKHSLHLEGRALDISIPGVPLSVVQRTALSLRIGGVGYYPSRDFVHIDSGPLRKW
jgi:uncharacterized protein YcbK (DUF882 family)